ncbi:hypothetical protein ACO1PK_13490 [Alishewanella sp. d11]|uniref:hypothetical protein n=1 Tax=Alishewanella sp. d11 TaxID=3414030 RepID=UPI003BF8D049
MKLLKTATCIALLIGSFAQAQTQKIETADVRNKMYLLNKVTAEQANYGVFHLSVPAGGSVVFVANGKDSFKIGRGINNNRITKSNNAIFFDFSNLGNGQYSLTAVTECGVAISAVVDVYPADKLKAPGEAINKVAFESPTTCNKAD